ncbi:hypothetical protein ACH51_06640 [Ralstonia solanacearum]|nr:hypothetical protein ACH51_06640 [Ralstonia solanacearum]
MSTIRSRTRAGRQRTQHNLLGSSRMLVRQARHSGVDVMASEPHTPSRHERGTRSTRPLLQLDQCVEQHALMAVELDS